MKNKGIKYPIGTEGGNRTRTVLPPPDFESGASTSSATSAYHLRAAYTSN